MFNRKPAAPAATTPPKPAPTTPPAAPPPGWAMLALTADYGVMGYLPPIDTPLVGFMNIPTQPVIALLRAQLQPVPPYGVSLENLPEVTLPKTSLLALIPRDEAGQRSAAQQMPGQGHAAVIYLGPFIIRATVPVVGGMPLRNAIAAGSGDMLALSHAKVHCQIPGTRFPDLDAPILIINKRLTQVFHPA